jgi:hypothetical protein
MIEQKDPAGMACFASYCKSSLCYGGVFAEHAIQSPHLFKCVF